MKYYLAIDLGASSGRHVIGYKDKDGIKLVEIYRFRTLMDDSADGLVWDIPRLYSEILFGIRKAFREYGSIKSLSIDTWGVDYVLMNGEKEITPYYAYRNARCQKAANRLHKEMKFRELYQKTGIQYAPFNTIYQLFDDKEKGRLDDATDYLMLPSYFTYKLTVSLPGTFFMRVTTVFAVLLAIVVYVAVLLIIRTFSAEEVKFLPKGEKIAKTLEKFHLIG